MCWKGIILMGKVVLISALFLSVLLVMSMESASMASASPADVNIWNEVGESIQMHCRSGDRDLKEMTLVAGGDFGWGFTPGIWGRTLFYCSFRWGARTQIFDVWAQHVDCTHCRWIVRGDGFWLRVQFPEYPAIMFVHPWRNP